MKDAHDKAIGDEWGAVRGYPNKQLKAILKHKLAGRSDARFQVACLHRTALGRSIRTSPRLYYQSSRADFVVPANVKRAQLLAALAAARQRDDGADCSDEELCEPFRVADLSGLDFTGGVRFSGKFIVDGCESWSKGTANGCSCVDGKHVLDVVWDETPGEVATCSIGDPDDELVLLQRMKPQAGLTRKDLRPAVLLSSGEDVTVMTTTDLEDMLRTLQQRTGQAELDDMGSLAGEDGEARNSEGSCLGSRSASEGSIMDLTGQGRAASDVSMQAASL